MNTKLFCALATAALTLSALADDQLRNVQTELKSQGFYYGDIDGKTTSETASAIRRYQIRNGLEVTGTLNKETLTALGMVAKRPKQAPSDNPPESAPSQTAKSKSSNPVNIRRDTSTEESDKEFLKREDSKDKNATPPRGDFFEIPGVKSSPPTPVPPRDPSVNVSREPHETSAFAPRESSNYAPKDSSSYPPRDPSVVAPPAPLETPSADFPVLFAGTPYANAPVALQQNTLRRAQSILANRGYYRDIIDGLPGPATEEALLTFQRAARLTLTGRLDLDTLNELRLLPGNNNDAGPRFGFEVRTPGRVFRGVWVQRW